MLFGTLIFIKKSGGDGSRFPVTNKSLKIGRSDECVIRIQNPLISPEHCQLTVDDNGQAKIRNLSTTNPTVLNDQPLGNGEFVLHQGDIFKLGERYARWEYQPTSKYYHQPSVSSQRLVAVVPPQERVSVGAEGNNSSNFNQALKSRYSERVCNSGKESVKKTMRRSLGAGSVVSNKTKLISRHSLQLKRLAFSPQVKLRKSTNLESSGTPNASSGNGTPLRRSSTWAVKTVSPEKGKSPQMTGSNRKSTPIKMPMSRLSNENLIKSTVKSASKMPNLLTIAETSPVTGKMSATHALDDVLENLNLSTSPKSPMKIAKTPTPKKIKLMTPRKSLSMSNKKKSFSRSMLMDGVQMLSHTEGTPETRRNSWKFTPSDKGTLRKSMLKKSISQSDLEEMVSEQKGTPQKAPGTPRSKNISRLEPVVEMYMLVDKGEKPNETKSDSVKSTPVKSGRKSRLEASTVTLPSTPKYSERLSRSKKSIPSGVLSTPKEKENVAVSPRAKPSPNRKSGAVAGKKTPQKRGTKREFSAVASAERAAKKLKTIAPTKPDKNKKAALLVLGKASRKLKALQNTNVVIKQKIVKKAIKLSTKSQKRVKPGRKATPKKSASPKKGTIQENKKTPVSSPEASTSSRRNSTPIGKTPTKDASPSKKVVSPDKAVTDSQGRRSSRSVTSSVLDQALSLENLKSPVPSKASDVESVTVSPNSRNTSFQYVSQVVYDPSRQTSKRLSSQNASSQPDFTELTPTALGLKPKTVAHEFVSPRPAGRRSSSLVTPRNKGTPGAMKSASTSKIHRKSVRFSGKDLNNSSVSDLNLTSGTIFDFDEVRTPNVTIDRFISPLSNQKTPKVQLKSPSSVMKSFQRNILRLQNETPTKAESLSPAPSSPKSPMMEMGSETSPEQAKKNQKQQKSPKNDLTDVKGVRQLMKTPKPQKSPKNDLTDVKGVRQLMKTPQTRKSPKNDLTDVRGVRRLMESPKQQKSPKNDLTDVRGVKRLMEPRKQQKSPKNDLTDVRGVRRLMESPKQQKSPKNDLTDVRGVKRLMEPPKPEKSPKNDLTDVKGVRRLMESHRPRKSPRNDLTDVVGVKQLMITKSPNNDLTNVSGLETLFKSPPNKIQSLRTLHNAVSKSPKNDLSNVSGVRQLFSVNKENNNLDVSLTGVAELFLSPNKSETPRKRTRDATSTASSSKTRRVSTIQATDSKPTLRGGTRSATKASRMSRAATIKSPIQSDEESPKVVKRATRSTRTAKVEKTKEVKRSRTKSERDVEANEVADEAAPEGTSSRSTRATRKQPTKRPVEDSKSPTPVKRTRRQTGVLAESKPSTPAKTSAASKTKKEPAKDVATKSKPSPIKTRRKSVARQSPKTVNRSTRAKASESVEEEVRSKGRAKAAAATDVSPVKTRQRKAKAETSPKKELKSSPVRTRRKAK